MVVGVSFDCFAEDAQVVFGGGFFGLLDVAAEFGNDDGGEDAEDGHDDHQLDECKTSFVGPAVPTPLLFSDF